MFTYIRIYWVNVTPLLYLFGLLNPPYPPKGHAFSLLSHVLPNW
uniref:Uncharacterized protein n=1 Tax=Rhizophora mucronata TaxID=61149 RepID=A0A2P2NUL4_RHIMU